MSELDLSHWLTPKLRALDAFLESRFEQVWPESFREPLRYPVFGGGKRVRPALVFAAHEACAPAADVAAAVPAAAAVELVHTYSLVHDDLPAMDDDDERRGRPTVHVQFDEATAILVGDALLTEAFGILADGTGTAEQRIAQVQCLARAAGHAGMVGGQVGDIAGRVSDVDALKRVHAAKTGALIRSSCVLGGLAASADPATLESLDAYGTAVGLAFQLADDVLDADEDAGDDGPPSYVSLMGVQRTRALARELVTDALGHLDGLPQPTALRALARFIVDRRS